MSIETEIAGTTTFEHFGREWTVPTKRHLSHIKRMRDEMRAGVGDMNLLIAETFLSPEEFDALLALDPDEDRLDKFTDKIAEALGLRDSGNS
jgi:hypothetical protein